MVKGKMKGYRTDHMHIRMPFERDPLQCPDPAAAPRLQCKEVKAILDHRLRRQDKTFGRLAQSRIDRLSFVRFSPSDSPLSLQAKIQFRLLCTDKPAYVERYRIAIYGQ
jgi:hypothetical protein